MARQDAEVGRRNAECGNEEADLRGGVKFSFSDFAYYQDQLHKKAFKAIRIGTKARWLFVSAEFCR
jgi:hypothetical protein